MADDDPRGWDADEVQGFWTTYKGGRFREAARAFAAADGEDLSDLSEAQFCSMSGDVSIGTLMFNAWRRRLGGTWVCLPRCRFSCPHPISCARRRFVGRRGWVWRFPLVLPLASPRWRLSPGCPAHAFDEWRSVFRCVPVFLPPPRVSLWPPRTGRRCELACHAASCVPSLVSDPPRASAAVQDW